MDSLQIKNIMKYHIGQSFIGVFPRNRLPEIRTWPSSLICNTDPDTSIGQHWIAIYLDEDGKGEYFDSYGLPPLHHDFINFLNDVTTEWTWNAKQLQDRRSLVCGQHCIFYLVHRYLGLTMSEIQYLFSNNYYENDAVVKHYVDKLCS